MGVGGKGTGGGDSCLEDLGAGPGVGCLEEGGEGGLGS